MVAVSFGRVAWQELGRIYETYRAVGGELEVAYRQAAAGVPSRQPRRPGQAPG